MAEFGAKYPCFKADGKDAGVVLGKLVAANLTVNLASGELYADDALDEQLSEFASGTVAMETNDLTDENAAEVYGCDVSEKVVTYNVGDTAPSGKLAYYKSLMRNKKKYYKTSYKKSIGRIEKSRKNIWQKVRLKRAAQRPLAKAKGGSES